MQTEKKLNAGTVMSVLLVLAVFAVFFPALTHGFVNWDDPAYVTENPGIVSFSLPALIKTFSSFHFGNYHPLTMVSYSLDHLLFKLDPRGYHLTNLLIHLLACVLVFRIARLLLNDPAVSFLAGLIFGIHPLHVEPVVWISGRKELLFTVFFLQAMISYIFYIRASGRARTRRYYAALFFFLLSLLSKSPAMVLPFALFLVDYILERRRDRTMVWDKIPFFCLSLIFGVLAVSAQIAEGAVRPEGAAGVWGKIATAGYCLVFYMHKIILPLKLACLYPRITSAGPGFFALPLALIGFFTAVSRVSPRLKKRIIFGAGFFLAALIPYLQLVPVSDAVVADRYAYLASFGIIFLFAALAAEISLLKPARVGLLQAAQVTCLVILATSLAFLARERCAAWSGSLALWNDAIAKYPDSIMAYHNRGITFSQRKEYDKAIADFRHAAGFVSDEDRVKLYRYISRLYSLQGNPQESGLYGEKAGKISADIAAREYEKGNAYARSGRIRNAIASYIKALAFQPGDPAISDALAAAYVSAGRYKQAQALYERALELSPHSGAAHNNLAVVHYYQGHYGPAWYHCERARELGYTVDREFRARLNKKIK